VFNCVLHESFVGYLSTYSNSDWELAAVLQVALAGGCWHEAETLSFTWELAVALLVALAGSCWHDAGTLGVT